MRNKLAYTWHLYDPFIFNEETFSSFHLTDDSSLTRHLVCSPHHRICSRWSLQDLLAVVMVADNDDRSALSADWQQISEVGDHSCVLSHTFFLFLSPSWRWWFGWSQAQLKGVLSLSHKNVGFKLQPCWQAIDMLWIERIFSIKLSQSCTRTLTWLVLARTLLQ